MGLAPTSALVRAVPETRSGPPAAGLNLRDLSKSPWRSPARKRSSTRRNPTTKPSALQTTADLRPKVASFARLVDDAALAGDPVAADILRNAAQHLALLIASIRRQLWTEGEAVQVVYIGGVFRSNLLLERFRMLVEMESGARCGPPVYAPAAGALLEAYRAAALHPTR